MPKHIALYSCQSPSALRRKRVDTKLVSVNSVVGVLTPVAQQQEALAQFNTLGHNAIIRKTDRKSKKNIYNTHLAIDTACTRATVNHCTRSQSQPV